jgi:hypothetical protein
MLSLSLRSSDIAPFPALTASVAIPARRCGGAAARVHHGGKWRIDMAKRKDTLEDWLEDWQQLPGWPEKPDSIAMVKRQCRVVGYFE